MPFPFRGFFFFFSRLVKYFILNYSIHNICFQILFSFILILFYRIQCITLSLPFSSLPYILSILSLLHCCLLFSFKFLFDFCFFLFFAVMFPKVTLTFEYRQMCSEKFVRPSVFRQQVGSYAATWFRS